MLLAAGDIASCPLTGDDATARLLDGLEGEVLTLGDNAYERGTADEFQRCYGPTWGRHRARTHPVPGNHDYGTAGARPYLEYFGVPRWYSWDLGGWHLVALDSNCAPAGGCGPGSPQHDWLVADLAANPRRCTLAYWHHPRFSSGEHGSSDATAPLWAALAAAGADVVLAGHDHHYERIGPVDGVRSWVVGTGGASLRSVPGALAATEARHAGTHGVLRLALHPDGYEWRFVPAGGTAFRDEGSATCR